MKENVKIKEGQDTISFSASIPKKLLPEQIEDLRTGKEVVLEGEYFIPKDLRLKKPPKIVKKQVEFHS